MLAEKRNRLGERNAINGPNNGFSWSDGVLLLYFGFVASLGPFDSSVHAYFDIRVNILDDVPSLRQTRKFVVLGRFSFNGLHKSLAAA